MSFGGNVLQLISEDLEQTHQQTLVETGASGLALCDSREEELGDLCVKDIKIVCGQSSSGLHFVPHFWYLF